MKNRMKQLAIATVASLALGLSSLSFADSGRHGYRDGYRDSHRNKEHYSRHYKGHSGKAYGHHQKYVKHGRAYHHSPRYGYRDGRRYYKYDRAYRKGYNDGRHHSHKRRHDDDIYLWLGGMYILKEALHHRH